MIELGVNIDHVATIREARKTYEPEPAWAAVEAHIGGADGITVHLREDRRHIQDADVEKLRTDVTNVVASHRAETFKFLHFVVGMNMRGPDLGKLRAQTCERQNHLVDGGFIGRA